MGGMEQMMGGMGGGGGGGGVSTTTISFAIDSFQHVLTFVFFFVFLSFYKNP